jgi:ribonuclease HI
VSAQIEVWTDGGCLGNPGPGAWAFVMRSEKGSLERSGYEEQTTNNRMEITAVKEAILAYLAEKEWRGRPLSIRTDSQYVQKGITEWIKTWARNGWKTTAKKPVKNQDLWASLWELSKELPVQWVWVQGHAGDALNERCDQLVQERISRERKQGA